jgi:hypothetical protein
MSYREWRVGTLDSGYIGQCVLWTVGTLDSGYIGHHQTGTTKIFRLQLGSLGKELVMVVKGEKNKNGYKMRERRRGGRNIKCGKGGGEKGNQWLILSLRMKAARFSEKSHPRFFITQKSSV